MIQSLATILLWFCAVGCGLIAGLYFAFSTFIMTALGRMDQASGIGAMNAINTTILRSPFMPLFFGTTLACALLAVLAVFRWNAPGAALMLAGGLIYVAGMFLCTNFFNVPLNNALAAVDPGGTNAAAVWARYLKEWTLWNHLRTVACGLFIAALLAGSCAV